MNGLLVQHLGRAWRKHWALQVASVTVMTLVLMILNLLFLGYSAFQSTVNQWGSGLEMTVYLQEGISTEAQKNLQAKLEGNRDFESVRFTDKAEATKKFLTTLGGESLNLLSDPKWQSPIPANYEIRLNSQFAVADRVGALSRWSHDLKAMAGVDDVFYGQGWIENFSKFLSSARGAAFGFWALCLSVGLLIVSNCIRLSFLQRKDEIEILELVGATPRFIRIPFLVEGVAIGVIASLLSISLSAIFHSAILNWIGSNWGFWLALNDVSIFQGWHIVLNIVSGLMFGFLGAWNCVRKLNTGWSAAVG